MSGVFGFGSALLGVGFGGVEFEVTQDAFGALDDGFWEAGEAGDLDAVTLVGGTVEDLAEEDDLFVQLADGDVVVGERLHLESKIMKWNAHRI
jgi:hypothetical protein